MAASFVDLANSALIRIGAGLITSFQDGTTESNAANARIWYCRDFVLRMHPWSCATQRVVLSPDLAAPAFWFTYQYSVPADWLRTLDVCDDPAGTDVPLGDRPDWRFESKKILCSSNPIYLRYIQKVTDPTQLDEGCGEAISAYLAYDLSKVLLQNDEAQGNLYKQFNQTIQNARNESAQELDITSVIDRYERVRRGW